MVRIFLRLRQKLVSIPSPCTPQNVSISVFTTFIRILFPYHILGITQHAHALRPWHTLALLYFQKLSSESPPRNTRPAKCPSQPRMFCAINTHNTKLVNPGFAGGAAAGSLVRASFSPDGRFVVSGSEKGQVRVWEAQEGKRVRTPLQVGYGLY